MCRVVLTLVFFLCSVVQATAQSGFGVAYYDVDKFYDTIPSKFYDDRAYTPSGRMRWNTERYRRKVENTVRVIDSMAMPVVVLYGVEGEDVVRDIVQASSEDYSYIHRTQDYNDGLDFAVLYFADKFFVDKVTPWRGALCVEGEAEGRKLAIVAAHKCSSLGVLFSECKLGEKGCNVILVGRPNKVGFNGLGLEDYLLSAESLGRGNRFESSRWIMRDRIAGTIQNGAVADVYIKSWMLDTQARPWATFEGNRYRGGYSSSLPIFIYFKEIFEL